MATDKDDVLSAFTSDQGFVEMAEHLLEVSHNANSPSSAILALQGLFSIHESVRKYQSFEDPLFDKIRVFLRKWRCDSLLSEAYQKPFGSVVPFLRSLTIFKVLEVPLFIDKLGKKELMKNFSEVENIRIDLSTPIVHVTHSEEARQIIENQGFKPSDNKNIIEGTWFSPKYQLGSAKESIHGNLAFETTLAELGVSCLYQGEIVSYKRMVNFILYAGESLESGPVQKATDFAVMARGKEYTTVSIFVPSRFVPNEGEKFKSVIRGPYKVNHKRLSFCLKEKREFIACPN